MIIVSQDKRKIINFNMCNCIRTLEFVNKDEDKVDIIVYFGTNSYETIGKYKSGKRVEEIIKEISDKYVSVKAVVGSKSKSINNLINLPKVYEMPKE